MLRLTSLRLSLFAAFTPLFLALPAFAQAEQEVPIPANTSWVSWQILLTVYLFIAAIILGPIVAKLLPPPPPEAHHTASHADPHGGSSH